MNLDMLTGLIENIVTVALKGKEEQEYIVAYVYNPHLELYFGLMEAFEKRRFMKEESYQIAQKIGYQFYRHLEVIQETKTDELLTKAELLRISSHQNSMYRLIDRCKGEIDEIVDLVFSYYPRSSADDFFELKKVSKSRKITDLKEYSIVVLSWSKDDINTVQTTGVNLHCYVSEVLAGIK